MSKSTTSNVREVSRNDWARRRPRPRPRPRLGGERGRSDAWLTEKRGAVGFCAVSYPGHDRTSLIPRREPPTNSGGGWCCRGCWLHIVDGRISRQCGSEADTRDRGIPRHFPARSKLLLDFESLPSSEILINNTVEEVEEKKKITFLWKEKSHHRKKKEEIESF